MAQGRARRHDTPSPPSRRKRHDTPSPSRDRDRHGRKGAYHKRPRTKSPSTTRLRSRSRSRSLSPVRESRIADTDGRRRSSSRETKRKSKKEKKPEKESRSKKEKRKSSRRKLGGRGRSDSRREGRDNKDSDSSSSLDDEERPGVDRGGKNHDQVSTARDTDAQRQPGDARPVPAAFEEIFLEAEDSKPATASPSPRQGTETTNQPVGEDAPTPPANPKPTAISTSVSAAGVDEDAPTPPGSPAWREQRTLSELAPAPGVGKGSFFAQLLATEQKKRPVGTMHATGRGGSSGAGGGAAGEGIKSSDWECQKCGKSNYKNASACDRCHALKRMTLWRD